MQVSIYGHNQKVFAETNQKRNKRRCYRFSASPNNTYSPYHPFLKTNIRGGHILGFEGRTGEDQIGPLRLEIGSFEGENPPSGFSPLVLEQAALWDQRGGLVATLKLKRRTRDMEKKSEDSP